MLRCSLLLMATTYLLIVSLYFTFFPIFFPFFAVCEGVGRVWKRVAWGVWAWLMACSANHSKGSGHGSAHGSGLIVGPNAWLQRKVHLRPQHRGVHLVTEEILRGVSVSNYIAPGWCWAFLSSSPISEVDALPLASQRNERITCVILCRRLASGESQLANSNLQCLLKTLSCCKWTKHLFKSVQELTVYVAVALYLFKLLLCLQVINSKSRAGALGVCGLQWAERTKVAFLWRNLLQYWLNEEQKTKGENRHIIRGFSSRQFC